MCRFNNNNKKLNAKLVVLSAYDAPTTTADKQCEVDMQDDETTVAEEIVNLVLDKVSGDVESDAIGAQVYWSCRVTIPRVQLQIKTCREVEEGPPSLNCLQCGAEAGVPAPMTEAGVPEPMAEAGVPASIAEAGVPAPMAEAGVPAPMLDAGVPAPMLEAGVPAPMLEAGVPALMLEVGVPA